MGLSRGKICLKKGEDKGFCIYLERVIRKIWACVVCVVFFPFSTGNYFCSSVVV